MSREFSADSLVTLPKFNVDSGLALWEALRAVVEGEAKLPKLILPAWKLVTVRGEALYKAAQTRLTAIATRALPAERRKADTVVDNAAGALDDYLATFLRLSPALPKVQLAAQVRQRLFPDGTSFLKLPFEQEWAQLDRRVALLHSEGLDKKIEQLGGEDFVSTLREAHTAYGKALGLTTVPAKPVENVTLTDPLVEFAAALRRYVIQVIAYRDEEEPATLELSERLLRPLTEWTSSAYRGGDDSAPGSEPPPEGEPSAS